MREGKVRRRGGEESRREGGARRGGEASEGRVAYTNFCSCHLVGEQFFFISQTSSTYPVKISDCM